MCCPPLSCPFVLLCSVYRSLIPFCCGPSISLMDYAILLSWLRFHFTTKTMTLCCLRLWQVSTFSSLCIVSAFGRCHHSLKINEDKHFVLVDEISCVFLETLWSVEVRLFSLSFGRKVMCYWERYQWFYFVFMSFCNVIIFHVLPLMFLSDLWPLTCGQTKQLLWICP